MESENENEHKFVLRIGKDVWDRFVLTLPDSISANDKIVSFITDFVLEYEYIIRGKKYEDTKQ